MKKLLAILMAALLSAPMAQAAMGLITNSGTEYDGSGTSVSFSMNVSVPAGSLIVVDYAPHNSSGAAYTTGVSDSLNGAYTKAISCFTAYQGQSEQWYVVTTTAGVPTITVTSSTSDTLYIQAAAFSGVATSSPLDGSACAGNDGLVSPSLTTTTAGDLLTASLGFAGNTGTVSAAAPWGVVPSTDNYGPMMAVQTATTAGSYAGATFTAQYASFGNTLTTAYKAAGSSGGGGAASASGPFSTFFCGQ